VVPCSRPQAPSRQGTPPVTHSVTQQQQQQQQRGHWAEPCLHLLPLHC
jgi:hypothetical protein